MFQTINEAIAFRNFIRYKKFINNRIFPTVNFVLIDENYFGGNKMSDSKLKDLGNPLRDVKKSFDELIIPHRQDLWRYCFRITGSPWDAEDLVQETLIKAFSSLSQLWQPINPKGFLFRIASNTWIDQCRKAKMKLDSSVNIETELASNENIINFEVNEALQQLVIHLPPRQRVVLLLIDVFQFKAKEVGGMIGTTEGAVKALLKRARVKLEQVSNVEEYKTNSVSLTEEQYKIIGMYIECFNRRDPDGIAKLMDDTITNDIVHIAQEYGKDTVRQNSLTDWAKDPVEMKAELHELWGRPTIVQLAKYEDTYVIYDLNLVEFEGNKIVKQKDYYFCPELLAKAGEELQMRAYPRKYTL